MEKKLHLVVIIPAYNEKDSIFKVVSDISKQRIDKCKKSLVVIDDGSTDSTLHQIPKKSNVYIIRHLKNRGLGRSFDEGVKKALELGADIVVNIDGDGQFDPRQIVKLTNPIIEGATDVALGSRFIKQNNYKTTLAKRWGNKFLAIVVSLITGKKIYDVTCGFRAYSREAALNLNIYDKFSYTLESLVDLSHKNFKIIEIPIDVKPRKFGKSKIANSIFYYGTKSIAILTRSLRENKPFHFFIAPALLVLTLSIAGFIFLLIRFIRYNALSPYRSVMTLSIVFLGVAIFIMGIGMIFDQLNKIKKNQEDILYYIKKNGTKTKK